MHYFCLLWKCIILKRCTSFLFMHLYKGCTIFKEFLLLCNINWIIYSQPVIYLVLLKQTYLLLTPNGELDFLTIATYGEANSIPMVELTYILPVRPHAQSRGTRDCKEAPGPLQVCTLESKALPVPPYGESRGQ